MTGSIAINAMTIPIIKIPSVEPISDRPSGISVGVICIEREAPPRFCDDSAGELKLTVTSAMTSKMNREDIHIMVLVFIALLDIIVSRIECVLFNPFMYFSAFSMYNPPSYYWLAGFSE